MKTLSITALTAAFLPSVLASPVLDPRGTHAGEKAQISVAPLGSAPVLDALPSAQTTLEPETAAPPIASNPSAEPALVASEAVDQDLRCLALNIYHEARSEPVTGQVAVARVTLNRVESDAFPGSICEVVKQGGQKRNRCQFSWWCDGKSDQPTEPRAWRRSLEIGQSVLADRAPDPTRGALYYHADYVTPRWSHSFYRTAEIGRHLFYRPRQS